MGTRKVKTHILSSWWYAYHNIYKEGPLDLGRDIDQLTIAVNIAKTEK